MPDLQLGDNDSGKIWGGVAQPQAPAANFVADLQRQLQELGFGVVRTSGKGSDQPGVFGYWTQMGVREFQAYARLPSVAVDSGIAGDPFTYTSHQKAANEVYGAAMPISGVVNAETARLLALWTSKSWRCPVIICGFRKTPGIKNRTFVDPAGAKGFATVKNAWSRYDHLTSAKVYCSLDYGDMTGGQPSVEIIGRARAMASTGSTDIGGLVVDGHLSSPDASISPASIIGPAPYSDAAKGTYRVVHTVAFYEVSGQFDAVNGWDAQILSFGPFQFVLTALGKKDTASPHKRHPTTGELPAFFAMLEAGSVEQRTAFAASFGALGLASDTPWAGIVLNASQRTLVSTLAFQDEGAGFSAWKDASAAKEPVRQWHLFRRGVVVARRSTAIQQAFWRFCRLRIRNLLATPWGAMDGYGWPVGATLGDVFRSELAAAVLLRLHVKAPGAFAAADAQGVVSVRDWLREAIADWDYANKTKPPTEWTLPAAGELSLVNAVLDRLENGAIPPKGGGRPVYVPRLSPSVLDECRGIVDGEVATPFQALQRGRSFSLDTSGL